MSNQIGVVAPVIRTIRGQNFVIDSDLARIYGVTAKRLNEQVKRNAKRFPPDFLFQLTAEEAGYLRSQFATLKTGRDRGGIETIDGHSRSPATAARPTEAADRLSR